MTQKIDINAGVVETPMDPKVLIEIATYLKETKAEKQQLYEEVRKLANNILRLSQEIQDLKLTYNKRISDIESKLNSLYEDIGDSKKDIIALKQIKSKFGWQDVAVIFIVVSAAVSVVITGHDNLLVQLLGGIGGIGGIIAYFKKPNWYQKQGQNG